MENTALTYCDQRLQKYGITEQWNKVESPEMYGGEGAGIKTTYEIFKTNDQDGIDITYLALSGSQIMAKKGNNKWAIPFVRKRLNPAKCTESQKYDQEKDTGVHIFINPQIIQKYQAKTEIETLYMVEGEFKSWLGYMNGLDIVCVPSISAYKSKGEYELHETIQKLITTCKVKNLVMIYDADLHSVKWEKWDKDEFYDLGKRINSFYKSAINIRDYARKLVDDVYLCHPETSYLLEKIGDDTVKGLDDMLLYHKGKEKDVVDELNKMRSSNKMFYYLNISAESPGKIREFFNLTRDKDGSPTKFFNIHQGKIGLKEFTFNGFRYQYSNKSEKLEVVKHPDSDKFIRIACDYMKVIEVPENIRGIKVTRRKLEPWKSGELSRDYVNKGFKNFFDTIQKYDQFTVYPDNTERYKQVIDNCYNLYYFVKHKAAEGEYDTIKMFLEHLFDEHFEMCLDYIQLLYLMPHQPLPILALVSEERGTGKTKFLELLREIFCENVTILGNDAITDNYNDDYASKLVIGIDEGLIEKKATVEKIKSWSTATRIKMNTKFMSRQEIPFYGKIIITSNNTDSFIQIEDQETRFWIRKVPKIKKEDPDLMQKMEKEIPAFLHFLKSRKLKHQKETRQWFAYHLLHTEALTEIKDASRTWIEKELKEIIEEEFFKYQYHCLPYTLTEIMEVLNGRNAGAKFRSSEVRRTFERRFKIKPILCRASFPVYNVEGETKTLIGKKTGRYYNLFIEEFLPFEEIKNIGYELEELTRIHDNMKKDKIIVEYWPNSKPLENFIQAKMELDNPTPGIHTGSQNDLPY